MSPKHFIDLTDFNSDEIRTILDKANAIKAARKKGELAKERPLVGKTLAMIFDKPSTRTRISFDMGMRQLGGECMFLDGRDMQFGHGETVGDTAQVLSRPPGASAPAP